MWGKRITSMLLMSLIIIGIISIPVSAAEVDNSSQASGQMNLANARATGVLNFTLSANTSKVAGQKFQMDAGETVRINASYTPFAADVDFGLVDSDGVFHYINTVFLLGDNRKESTDSRTFGCLDIDRIVGVALVKTKEK